MKNNLEGIFQVGIRKKLKMIPNSPKNNKNIKNI